jgi:hypothetical protein
MDTLDIPEAAATHPLPDVSLSVSVRRMRLCWAIFCVMALVLLSLASGEHGLWRDFPLVVGSGGVLFCVYAFARSGRLRFTLDDAGLTYTGLFRSVDAPWSSIRWVGWLMQSASANSPTTYSLAVGVRGRRLPCCLLFWVSSRTLASLNTMTQSEVKHEIELAINSRNVWYRPRIPDMTPVALWFVITAIILALAFIPFATIALTR